METTLRPLTLGEILDRTASIYRKNFLLLAGISTIYAANATLLNVIQVLTLHQFESRPKTMALVSGLFFLCMLPILLLLVGITIAAINRAVSWIHLNQPVTIRGAYRSVMPRLGRYIWLMFLVGLRIYWPIAILLIPIIVIIVLARTNSHHSDPTSGFLMLGAMGLVTTLLAVGAFAYMVWQGLRLALAVPACVVEDLKAGDAMKRSIQLTQGSRGRIFVLGLLVAVIQMGLSTLGMMPFMVFGFRDAMAHQGHFSLTIQLFQQLVNFLTISFVTPIYSTGFMLFYYDQRIRKEGFDIEWMMQAAGLSVPSAVVVEANPTTAQEDAAVPLDAPAATPGSEAQE
jgi:membrane-anchored glycerophosphoryl diester phosphodiesterase (GDPDase)